MNTKTQPRTLTNCPELLLDIMRKCAWVNHLFTTCLGEKLLEIASDHSNLWPRKLRKIACFRKLPENSKYLVACFSYELNAIKQTALPNIEQLFGKAVAFLCKIWYSIYNHLCLLNENRLLFIRQDIKENSFICNG